MLVKKITFNNRRYEYIATHCLAILPYLTFEKFINLFINLFEKSLKITVLRSYPIALKIDPGPFCQLHCPACFHRDNEFNKRFSIKDNLSIEKLKIILAPIQRKLLFVSLSYRGEPFTNPNLTELIEYIHKCNIAVGLPTNFSFNFTENQIIKIANSGLDRLYVSLDGASKETNEKYRVGSNYELILHNVKRLADYKKRQKLSHPEIIWKFVIFDHNKHEIDIVKKTYKILGFNSYFFVNDNNGIIAKKERQKTKLKSNICYWLWHTMIIQSDGQVNPCCKMFDFNIGNAFKTNVLILWNNKVYQSLRNGFRKKKFPNKLHKICSQCYDVNK